jgi:hypothetical protein
MATLVRVNAWVNSIIIDTGAGTPAATDFLFEDSTAYLFEDSVQFEFEDAPEYYLRPGGVDYYRRPGGVDRYLRP